jgi:hypothetical protein
MNNTLSYQVLNIYNEIAASLNWGLLGPLSFSVTRKRGIRYSPFLFIKTEHSKVLNKSIWQYKNNPLIILMMYPQ